MFFDSPAQLFYHHGMNLILASRSPYRRALLEQAGFQFLVEESPFDEELFKKENPKLSPQDLCLKLAEGKASKAYESFDSKTFILGSDQLIELDGEILSKPGSLERALKQLTKMQGQTHTVYTSLALINPEGKLFSTVREIKVRLRSLSESDISAYLEKDKPFDCAGSYKMEKAGLLLAQSIEGGDPSAIQGLSLIDLTEAILHFQIKPSDFWSST